MSNDIQDNDNRTYEGHDQAEPQPAPERGEPHARLDLRFENQGITLDVTTPEDPGNPAIHFARWIGANLNALVMLARQDYHLQAQIAGMQTPPQEPPSRIEAGTPRLVSASGGPLQ